jgi:hypothetical protein
VKSRFATVLLSALLLMPVTSLAQGCAMCFSTASAASKDGQRAISKGVVILVIPPLAFMTLGVGAAFRYSKKRDRDHESNRISML